MAKVQVDENAQADIDDLPLTIQGRVQKIIERLEKWPDVSGVKALKGELKGKHRIRTGDWRVIFEVKEPDVIIIRVAHRSTVYEDD